MTAHQFGISDPFIRFHASGWIISLVLHGGAIVLAGLLVAKIGLAPPSLSFQWDVTVVGSQPPAPPAQVIPGAQSPATAVIRPAQRNAPATALHPPPSPAMLPTVPATTPSSTAAVARTIEPALPPPHQTFAPLLDRTPVEAPSPEPQKAKNELPTSPHMTSAPMDASPDPRSLSQMANPPLADAPAAPEMSGPTSRPTSEFLTTTPAQTASLVPSNSTTQIVRKPDYGWLAGPLLQRIEALKQYPVTARLHRLEGRVMIRIVIQEDGHITSATIARSSGHDVLDQAALETIRQVSPLTLSQPLEKSSVTMQIPLGYYLDR